MPRLSVSLSAEQYDWVAEQADRLDVSKARVVRECLKQVRTDESLFTTPNQSDDSIDSDGITEVLSRLDRLEEVIRNETSRAQADINIITSEGGPDSESNQETTQVNAGLTTHTSDSDGLATDDPRVDDEHEGAPEAPANTNEETHEDSTTSHHETSQATAGQVSSDAPQENPTDDSNDERVASPSTSESPSPGDEHNSASQIPTDCVRPGTEEPDEPKATRPQDDPVDTGSQSSPSERSSNAADQPSEHQEGPSGPTESPPDDGATRDEVNDSKPLAASERPPERGDSDTDGSEKFDVDRANPDAIRHRLETVCDDQMQATAVFECWKRIRDRGTVHTRSMQALYEDYPLGYQDARAWWHESIQPVLVKVPGVRPPEGSGKLYRFKY